MNPLRGYLGLFLSVVLLTSGCGKEATPVTASAASNAAATRPVPSTPVLCREATWDFGTRDNTKTREVAHTFRLENVSDRTVQIEKVEPTCGCIVSKDSPTELAPGATGDVSVTVNLAGPPGKFLKFVNVRLKTEPAAILTLAIQGTVEASPAFYVVPTTVDFGIVAENETKTRVVKISRYDGSPVRFDHATPESDSLAQVNAKSGDAADSFVELTVALDGSRLNQGDFQSRLVGVTLHGTHREVMIPVKAKIAGQSHGLVDSIFCQLPSGASLDLPLHDHSLAGNAVPLPTVQSIHFEEGGVITVELLQPEKEGAGPVLRVSRSEDQESPKVVRGELLVTLSGRTKAIRIPLRVFLSKPSKS